MYTFDTKATAVSDGSLWIPIDHNVVTPFHWACNRVPGMFPPTCFVRGTVRQVPHNTLILDIRLMFSCKRAKFFLVCCGQFWDIELVLNIWGHYSDSYQLPFSVRSFVVLTLSQQTLYIYHAPSKARNANVIYISH